MLVFFPNAGDTTDLVAVTDCDLGRMEKLQMRSFFAKDFDKHPTQWIKSGVSPARFRVKMTRWALKACKYMETQKGAMIVNAFKSCGFFNAMDGSEDHLIKIRGSFFGCC